jgi:hypothetical protein
MMSDKKPKVGIKIEEQEERPYDLMRVTLPVPRLFRLPKETRQHLRAARRTHRGKGTALPQGRKGRD